MNVHIAMTPIDVSRNATQYSSNETMKGAFIPSLVEMDATSLINLRCRTFLVNEMCKCSSRKPKGG